MEALTGGVIDRIFDTVVKTELQYVWVVRNCRRGWDRKGPIGRWVDAFGFCSFPFDLKRYVRKSG